MRAPANQPAAVGEEGPKNDKSLLTVPSDAAAVQLLLFCLMFVGLNIQVNIFWQALSTIFPLLFNLKEKSSSGVGMPVTGHPHIQIWTIWIDPDSKLARKSSRRKL